MRFFSKTSHIVYRFKFLIIGMIGVWFCSSHAYTDTLHKDTSYTAESALLKAQKKRPELRLATASYKDSSIVVSGDYSSSDQSVLSYDLCFPSDSAFQPYPLIILVHGGGWRSGNRSLLLPFAKQLNAAGFASAVIDYRLSTEATFPAATDDILKALKYFKKNDTTFSINQDRIVLLGCSAGATLASYVAVTSSEECAALINIDGVVDLTDPNESGKDTEVNKPSAAAMYIGGTFAECPEKWVEASPLSYANGHSPPVLFINSSQDRFHAGRDAFLQVYQQEGLFYRVKTLSDAPHTFWLFDRWFDETNTEIVHFLVEVFDM